MILKKIYFFFPFLQPWIFTSRSSHTVFSLKYSSMSFVEWNSLLLPVLYAISLVGFVEILPCLLCMRKRMCMCVCASKVDVRCFVWLLSSYCLSQDLLLNPELLMWIAEVASLPSGSPVSVFCVWFLRWPLCLPRFYLGSWELGSLESLGLHRNYLPGSIYPPMPL